MFACFDFQVSVQNSLEIILLINKFRWFSYCQPGQVAMQCDPRASRQLLLVDADQEVCQSAEVMGEICQDNCIHVECIGSKHLIYIIYIYIYLDPKLKTDPNTGVWVFSLIHSWPRTISIICCGWCDSIQVFQPNDRFPRVLYRESFQYLGDPVRFDVTDMNWSKSLFTKKWFKWFDFVIVKALKLPSTVSL